VEARILERLRKGGRPVKVKLTKRTCWNKNWPPTFPKVKRLLINGPNKVVAFLLKFPQGSKGLLQAWLGKWGKKDLSVWNK